MTPEGLAALDTWGRLDLVDEVVRLRLELTAERAVSASLREQLASLTGKVLGERILIGGPA